MFEFINLFDFPVFKFINGVIANDLFNAVLPVLREKTTWYPLYFIIIAYAVYKFKFQSIPIVLCLVATAGVCDYSSAKIIKPLVERPRPCNETELEGFVETRANGCRRSYSFPSSHATNHFGLAMAIILCFGVRKRWKKFWWIWAGLIAFAQVYVGLHYPSDVIFGAWFGVLLGYGVFKLFQLLPDLLTPAHWRKSE